MSTCAKIDYETVDEKTQNAYNTVVVRAALADAIQNTHSINKLSMLAKQVFGVDCQIVRWVDDYGYGLAYPKDNDKMQEHLAFMARKQIGT